jgi:hypothetical protein
MMIRNDNTATDGNPPSEGRARFLYYPPAGPAYQFLIDTPAIRIERNPLKTKQNTFSNRHSPPRAKLHNNRASRTVATACDAAHTHGPADACHGYCGRGEAGSQRHVIPLHEEMEEKQRHTTWEVWTASFGSFWEWCCCAWRSCTSLQALWRSWPTCWRPSLFLYGTGWLLLGVVAPRNQHPRSQGGEGAWPSVRYPSIPRCQSAHKAVLYSASAVVICPR